jgi:carboxyl-terminal processing protease
MSQVLDQDGPLPVPLNRDPDAGTLGDSPPELEREMLERPEVGLLNPASRRNARRSRAPLLVALVALAVLSGSGLFVAGFTLGSLHERTPGTSVDDQALFDPYWQAYHKIVSDYVGTFTNKQLVEGSIKGMFQALGDPYSLYMTSEEYKASLSGVSGQFEGIGAEMSSLDAKGQACPVLGATCFLDVVRVIRKSPAEQSGLLAGDIVTAVDNASVAGLTVDQSVTRIRGPRDTVVKLSLQRAGKSMDLSITRGVVQAEDVTSSTLANGQVGYLKISGFSSSAAADFQSLLKDQLAGGVRKYVIDLRDDPGGFVDAALNIASQFIGSGPVYWEEHADGVPAAQLAKPGGQATDPSIRLVVLVNGGSASASEILAGALHDTGRATLVGTKTFGKGTIQQWIQLPNDNGGFRLSFAKWLTPNQTWIHGVGITPDVVVPVPAGTPQGQDPQLSKALDLLAAAGAGSGAGVPGGPSPVPTPVPTPAGQVRFSLPVVA